MMGTRVTKRQYSIEQNLPLPEDIVKLREFLASELKIFNLHDHSTVNYRTAVQLVETKLISYNRRRSGEIQALRMTCYEKRKKGVSEIDIEMTRELTEFEKHLLDSQEVVGIRGKGGKGVPVIIPSECQSVLAFLVDPRVRNEAGIHEENKYVFAASRGLAVVRGYESLSHVCRRAGLTRPEKVTSVTLRKYMATVTQIFYTTGDISNRDDRKSIIDKTIEHFGCLDVLVNNAGVASYVPMQEVTEKEYDRLMDTNMKAMFFFSQLAVPHLIKTKGNIVNVSSIAGPNVITSMLLYSITKAAVDSYTKALALELGPHGIRVNAVNPGTIITDVFKRVKNPTDEEFAQFLETQKSKHPLGRVGTPDDVAEVIAFLASDHARFVTGDLVFVDGGRNALGVNAIFKT